MKGKLLLPALLISITSLAQPRLPNDYYWEKLPNGLEVVVIENSKVPLATIEIAVKNGAYTEGPEFSGLSHLFEHMFFKANIEYPTQERFLKRTQELGMIWNGTTDVERVNYFFTFNKDSLKQGLQFMNAAIRFPIYRTEDMEKERPVVDGEFQRGESDPAWQLGFEVEKKVWGDLFTRKNPIGDHTVINTATPEKMMIIKGKYYHPNNSLLVICGDVKHDQAFALASSLFGDWPNSGFNPHEKYPLPDFKPIKSNTYFIKQSSIAQTPNIEYEWQGPDYLHDSVGTIAASVFTTLLSMNSSKWQQALVDKGLATVADVSYQLVSHIGPISIFITPNPNKIRECHQEVLKQIAQFANDDYFSEEQLQDAKGIMQRNTIRANEKPSTLSSRLSYHWCSTSLDYFTDFPNNRLKVSKQDIQNFIHKYITGQPYVAGIIINNEMNKAANTSDFFKP